MSTTVLIVLGLLIYGVMYFVYGKKLQTHLIQADPNADPPSKRLRDDVDFVPTNKWVLFGHHFAAIAGAGPLIGPILAAQYGWGPGFLWILLGSVFAGGIHDMIILFASVRHKGQSLAVIARKEVGPVAGFTTSLSILMIIIIR